MAVLSFSLLVMAVALGVASAWLVAHLLERLGWVDALAAGAAALFGGGAVLGVAVTFIAFGLFATVHWMYLWLTATLPAAGLGLVVVSVRHPEQRPARIVRAVGVVAMLLAPLGLYATYVEPRWLHIDPVTVEVATMEPGDEPVTVAVLADLQASVIGPHERRAVQEIVDADPDLILVPGDILHTPSEPPPEVVEDFSEQFARLAAVAPTYVVRGDVDPGDRVDRIMAGTGAVILDDAVAELEVHGVPVAVGGVRLRGQSWSAAAIDELLRRSGSGEVTILLSHRPDVVYDLPPHSDVDLTVAGHTHGGQIQLPLYGPLTVLSDVPRHVGGGGLHTVDGNEIYVSPGVGVERGLAPQVRFGVRPAVGVLTLSAAGRR